MPLAEPFWNPQRIRLASVGTLAAVLGYVLVLALKIFAFKWLVCILLGLSVLCMAIISRRFNRFMLMLLFLAIPVNIDIHFDIGGASLDGLNLPNGTPRLGISVIDILLLVLYPIWIGRMLVNPALRKIQWPTEATIFLCFIGWGALSLLSAPNLELGMALGIGFVRAFMLFFYMVNNIKTRDDLWLLAWCIAAGLAMEGLLCLAQKKAGGNLGLGFLGERSIEKEMEMGASKIFRVGGTQGHPNALGGYLCSVLPVSLALCMAPISKSKRIILTGIFGLGLLALILSFSRSAWVSAFLACGILGGWILFSQRKRLVQLIPVLIIGGFLLMLLATAFGPYIKTRMEQDDKGSTLSRIPQWQMAFSIIKANPFFGAGMNNYNMVLQKYETYVEDPTSHGRVFLYQGRPHNVFLGIAAEMGIPALLLIAAYIISVTKRGLRQISSSQDELTRLILAGLLLGFLGRIPHDAFHTGDLASHVFFWLYPACLISRKEEKIQ